MGFITGRFRLTIQAARGGFTRRVAGPLYSVFEAMTIFPRTSLFCAHLWAATSATPPTPIIITFFLQVLKKWRNAGDARSY